MLATLTAVDDAGSPDNFTAGMSAGTSARACTFIPPYLPQVISISDELNSCIAT